MIRSRAATLRLLSAAILLGLLGVFSRPALAAGLQISPISLSIPVDKKADEIWLRNSGDAIVHAQVRVFRWSQANGDDVLTADNFLVASPPMVQIQPGQQQLVRLVRVGPMAAPAPQERSYRLLVDELPIKTQQTSKAGLNFVFRYSIPVFIVGTAEQKPALEWQVQESKGRAWLRINNGGTRHSQLADVSFAPPQGKPVRVFTGLAGYVLPGQYRLLELPQAPSAYAKGGTFTSLVNGQETRSTVAPITAQP